MPSERAHTVKTPLPPDDAGVDRLLLRSMKVKERISSPFEYVVELVSEDFEVDANELLGESMTIIVNVQDRSRYFNGLVSNFVHLGREGNYAHYRATLRPWLWFLCRNADCRIFQELSVTEIFEEVVKETHEFSDYRFSLTESYEPREYCVQYRESDFHFVSRLLEEEGIFYFFEHEEDKHTLVPGDSKSAYGTVEGDDGSDIPYRPPGEAQVELEHISLWQVQHALQSGAFVLDDFDFTKPKVDLLGQSQVDREHTQADYEVYDYPGRYSEVSNGETYAKIRIEELQSRHKRLRGEGDHRGLQVGQLFNLTEYPRDDENAEYVLLSTEIEIESAEVEQMRTDAENRFDVSFLAHPSDDPFRPKRATPRPFVKGPQTAIVVGKDGEEIWTDEYGRVKVQFHWDREGESNEDSSCWIRVSQHWAGKTWGGIQIPRIGQEVIVDFLEGDPDRPLITGRVYNNDQMPPYGLPDNQTQSGVKSRSTKEGAPDNFNELRFEDKKDEEEVYFHAEKNFVRIVENDDSQKVGFEKMDPGDQAIEVYNNQVLKVGDSSAPDGSQTIEVWKDRTAEIKTGDDSTTVSAGNHSLAVSAGESTIEAALKITLKVGGSTIVMEPGSITIKSPQITVEGDATADMKSPMTTVEGSGMATLKGGLVKIN